MPINCLQSVTKLSMLVSNASTAQTEINDFYTFLETINRFDIGDDDYNVLYSTKWQGVQDAINNLNLLKTRMEELVTALNLESNPSATLDDYKDAIALFEIQLSVADGFQCADKWDSPENGIRIKEVYKAIRDIALAIAREFADGATVDDEYKFLGACQFVDSFGGVEFRIANGTINSNPPVGYALTENANLILLWDDAPLKTEDDLRGYPLHTAANLVHEMGHILDIRIGLVNPNDAMGDEWGVMRNEFGESVLCEDVNGNPILDANGNQTTVNSLARGFRIDEGWVDFTKRENKLDFADFQDPANPDICPFPSGYLICVENSEVYDRKDIVCAEMELERIADMFLFWTYSDDIDYQFDINNPIPRQQTRAQAMHSFSFGGIEWTRGNTTLTPTGFLNWVIQAEGYS